MQLNRLNRRKFLGHVGRAALSTLTLTTAGCLVPRHPRTPPPTLSAPPWDERSAVFEDIEIPDVASPPPVEVAEALLPTPDFDRVLRFVAGIRPYRNGCFRLEVEEIAGRTLVHNYGHGGAGITLSWGCAEEAAALVMGHRTAPGPVAILGAGVMGLSTAQVLLDHGYRVTIYAREFTPNTTSNIAGGQWAPSFVSLGRNLAQRRRSDRILRRSHARFTTLIGQGYGVSVVDNYTTRRAGGTLGRVRAILPPHETIDALPFAGKRPPGRLYRTLLIEPPIYMPRLTGDVNRAGATLQTADFSGLDDVLSLPEKVIVNCLGLGARDIIEDRALIPARGQLVHLEPQELPYLLSHRGYIFPRKDAVVLGGTTERGVDDPTPNTRSCRRILATNRSFFLA